MDDKYFKEFLIEDKISWNLAVKKLKNYEVFYLNEYVLAFQRENQENGKAVLIVYENKYDYAINVVFCRDVCESIFFKEKLEKGKYFDLISPYGYGGFIGNISDYTILNCEYEKHCIEHGYICEFVRFELFSSYKNFYANQNRNAIVQTITHNVIRNLEDSLDKIWMDFKHKVRKNVKKASNHNLEIIIDETGKYLDDFLNIYYTTMERTHASQEFFFSKSFFETINEMSEHYVYFYVKYENKIISTELVLYGSENCYSYLGGTIDEYFDLRPNDFLKFEIIKWAKEKKLKNFILGGGYGSDDGIFQYKACLAPNGIINFYIGKKIFNLQTYNKLCKLRGIESHSNSLEECGFFPEYRKA